MVRALAKQELTGVERTFDRDEIIVSKTDLRGRITYANQVFLRIAGLTEMEALGAPHNLIRHESMPRCVFQFMWDVIGSGEEIFAYVINRAMDGSHYWVFAHVTPTFGPDGAIIGYHSNRRQPKRAAIEAIQPLYKKLCAIESKAQDPREGLKASRAELESILAGAGVTYSQFVFSL